MSEWGLWGLDWRTAMPAPTPEGVTYHYHPGRGSLPTNIHPQLGNVGGLSAPAVTAQHNGQTIGYLSWMTDHNSGPLHGEIGMVQVHPDYRRHGVATGLYDAARQAEPTVHHSDEKTPLGNAWARYEQGRTAATSQKIYRGLNIEHGAIPANYHGDGILDHLQNSHYEDGVGLGRHWTTDPQVAMNSIGNWGHKILLEGEHDGIGIDPNGTDTHGQWDDEQEVTLLPDSPVRINSVKVQHPHTGEWHERLDPGWRGVEHTAGANGDTPPLSMEPFDSMWFNGIMARHKDDDRPVGYLTWHPDGEIDAVHVHPDFQRRGIATQMLNHAKSVPEVYQASGEIRHSNQFSPAGRAWAESDPNYTPTDSYDTFGSEDNDGWGWKPPPFVPAHHPYTGQNEEELSPRLTPGYRTAAAEPEYMYHATNEYNAQDIKDHGSLVPNAFDYGTDQGSWPDGSNEDRSYWHHDPKVTESFHPEDGNPVLLRAPKHVAPFGQERGTGDSYSTHPVDARHLEVHSGGGQWTPLHDW